MKTICAHCSRPYEEDHQHAACPDCRPKRQYSLEDQSKPAELRHGNRHARGYDNHWARLSKRARELQPFCSDCGRTDDLTADHSERAWQRRAAGKSVRLKDIDVVCRGCNSDRGAARGSGATDKYRDGGNPIEFLS